MTIYIPKILKSKVWVKYIGKHYESKCYNKCCRNKMNVFTFCVTYNVPESKGGSAILENLRPICQFCNLDNSSVDQNSFVDEFNSSENGCFSWFR
jgi:hypothetical protein